MARGSMSTPFVARAQQVDQLTLALQRAGVGEPATVLIGADAGVGKTRLLRHVAELADAAGARVVVAHCVDLGEIGLPYLPFAEALSQLYALDPEAVGAVVANRPALARLLPGPVRLGGRPGRPVEPAPAVRRAGRGARRGRPPGAPAPAGARGPALGGRLQPGRAALPRLAAARPAPARGRQLPHGRPAPAPPVAARRHGAEPAPPGRAARPVAVHRRRAARVHHRAERHPADGVHAAPGHRPVRGQRVLRGGAPGGRRRGGRAAVVARRRPARPPRAARPVGPAPGPHRVGGRAAGCPSRCCAPPSPPTGTRS